MNNILIANIFSAVGTSLLAYSTFSKNKEKMLTVQIGDAGFNALGNIFAGSYTGCLANLIAMVRNILNSKGKLNKKGTAVLITALLVLGIICNTKGVIGLIPPVSSVQYTIWSFVGKSAQSLRFGLVVNLLLWFIHDFNMQLYPAMIVDIVILLVTLVNIWRFRQIETKK